MARTARTGQSRGVLRAVVVTFAVLLAAGSTAAVVLTEDPQRLRLAVVGALWAFILLALAAPRRRSGDDDAPAEGGAPGKEMELRRTYEIELEREVAARREYELQLEVYLRRELERGLAEDVQTLRDEIQRMRGEMLDRLDGELRMERIETTRLIGGSLRALQDEARRLGMRVADPISEPSFSVREPAPAPRSELTAGDPLGYPTDAVPSTSPPVPAASRVPATAASAYSSFPSYADAGPYQPASYLPASDQPASYQPAPYEPPSYQPAAYPTAPPVPAPPGPLDAYLAAQQAEPPPPPSRVDELGPILGGPIADLPPAPAPRSPQRGESVPRRRRARGEGEDNEVMSRLLGR